jgi:hypothetical protein
MVPSKFDLCQFHPDWGMVDKHMQKVSISLIVGGALPTIGVAMLLNQLHLGISIRKALELETTFC